jgi:DNA repair exonuclease SbcCD ATPase subunit
MEKEISTEEMGQIIRAARVLSTDFDEKQIQSLSYAWQKLADSGFLDAVWGMTRLQQEQGISCSEALDANKALLKQKEKLERELASLKEKVIQEQYKYSEATQIYQQMAGKINSAKNELQATGITIQKEQEWLTSLRAKAEKEERRIQRELERCKKNANVTTEEIVAAGQLKAEVEKSGFNLETMLGLAEEFAPYQDARDRLAGVLKTSQSLTRYLAALKHDSEEKKKSIDVEIGQLLNRKGAEESELKRLEQTRHQLEINVSRLHSDVDEEQGLRQFYIRYSPLSDLLEYLVTWRQVYFLRCDNPMCEPFAGVTHFWTDRLVRKCPHCGLSVIKPDPEPFRLLNMPEGTEFKLKLG